MAGDKRIEKKNINYMAGDKHMVSEEYKENNEYIEGGKCKKTKEVTRTVEYSRTVQMRLVAPANLNGGGRLFGGDLLQMIDEVAAIVAKRHTGQTNVTTASIDNLIFKDGAYVDELLVLVGYITHVGNSSMEVRVDTYVENLNGERRPINRAYLVMVALDDTGRPKTVPRIKLLHENERAEWEAAEKRRGLRLERRIEGF